MGSVPHAQAIHSRSPLLQKARLLTPRKPRTYELDLALLEQLTPEDTDRDGVAIVMAND